MEAGVAHALDIGAISFDAVKMIVLARLEHRPPRLDLSLYPYLPRVQVRATDTSRYLGLLGSGRCRHERGLYAPASHGACRRPSCRRRSCSAIISKP